MTSVTGATTANGAKYMDVSFELPIDLEQQIHGSLLVDMCLEQRIQFRPGVQRKSGAALDILTSERTKKKIARALTVLQEEYGVSEDQAREALAYTNSWEDALTFLALQLRSSELPVKLRAKPENQDSTLTKDEEDSGSLAVVAAVTPVAPEVDESQSLEQISTQIKMAAVTVENWDEDEEEMEAKAKADAAAEAAAAAAMAKKAADDKAAADAASMKTQNVEEAMSWTQRYLLQLEAEEEREKELRKQEAALTPEERQLRDLELQYTALQDKLRDGKASGKLTKKKQKAVSQDIQLMRMQLIRLGWREDEYRRKQQVAAQGESGAMDDKAVKADKKNKIHDKPAATEVPAESDDRVFYERDGRQSRLGFHGDEQEGEGEQDGISSRVTPSREHVLVVDACGDVDDDDEDQYGGGLFDQPATIQPVVAAPVVQAAEQEDDKPVTGGGKLLAGFPAALGSWTGKTPRDLLQDYCQKHKMQRPQYKKLSTKGTHLYSVTLDKKGTPRQEFAADDELFTASKGFRTIDEAKDTVSTVALYTLTPHLPLYGMMPPAFRALWLEWEREKQAQATASVVAVKSAFDTLVDEIFQSVPEEIAAKTPAPIVEPVETNKTKQASDGEMAASEQAEPTLDAWDVDDWDADLSDGGADTADATAPADVEQVLAAHIAEPDDPINAVSSELKELFVRNTRSDQYQKLLPRRNDLPIASFKDTIVHALDTHNVILISGETGCGKSTQVPQYLLEEMVASRAQGSRCQIVCTQPRRLAATSLAERVSHELGEKSMAQGDSLCGYQIRLENRMTRNTRLLFCTTGILLRKLQEATTLDQELSHIIVDEVHERDVQNDVLLSMLRTFLETRNLQRKHPLKVILMSATLNAASFQHYFGGKDKCPMLSVPGRTFPVQEFYLEDALETTQFVVDESSPSYRRQEDAYGSMNSTKITISGRGGTSRTQTVTWRDPSARSSSRQRGGGDDDNQQLEQYSDQTLLTLDRLDESVINYELIEQLVQYLVTESDALRLDDYSSHTSAAILVFMPGLQEISNLLDVLSGNRFLRDSSKFELLPLHSSLSPEDQRRIFSMRRGVTRIIATTNIAETSLTIEDVKVVIDSGRAKEMRHDSSTRTNLLEEIWISRANAKQRLGRAGRTSGGICYRLFSRETHQHRMPEQPLPEIKRAPLTSLCLQIKTFGVESSCAQFLEGCLDPPEATSVRDALRELYEVGALEMDPLDATKEQLTQLGSHLAQLPVDVKVGKLLLLGAIFGEFDAISTCAAILETKSPFVAPYGFQKEMQASRQRFAIASSDLLTDCNAFHTWRDRFASHGSGGGRRGGGNSDERAFCRQYFLSQRSCMEISKLKNQFAGIVSQMGFLDSSINTNPRAMQAKPLTTASCALLAALLYAGLEPNVMYVDPALSSTNRVTLRADDGERGSSRAFVHPGSINAKTTSYASPFLSYAVKLHTSQVYVPACSMVLPSALCVFSFAMEIVLPHHATASGDVTIKLNDWIALKSSLRSAVVLQQLRGLVRSFIDRRIESPPFRRRAQGEPTCETASGGSRSIEESNTQILGVLTTLFDHEYTSRDTKHVLLKQLNPPLKS